MREEDFWQAFCVSGKIEDYLSYKKNEAAADDYKNTGSSGERENHWS